MSNRDTPESSLIAASFRTSEGGACDGSPFTPRHYHLKLDYGNPSGATCGGEGDASCRAEQTVNGTRTTRLAAEDYVQMWRGEYEPRGLWISDEFRRADAEVWAAFDRAFGPTPTMALRFWRHTQEAFGDGSAPSCRVRRFVRPTLRVVG